MDNTDSIKFAVIDPDSQKNDGSKLIKWYSPQDFSNVLQAVPNFRFTTAQDITHEERRVVNSNQHTWILLSEFFKWRPDAISPAAMCVFEGFGPNVFTRPFIKSHLGNHDHFVFERGGKHILTNPKEIEKVRFITGHCLFSNRHLWATSHDGDTVDILNPRVALTKPIARINADNGLSFYELEASMRLTRFMSDIALSLPENMQFEIRLDVPFVQYYFYLIDAYWRKLLSRDLLLLWFELIEKRHELTVERLKRQIGYWFTKSDLPAPDIVVNEGLRSVKDIIIERIVGTQTFEPKEIAAALESYDPAWKVMNSLINQNSYMDIVYASYCLEYLRANIEKSQNNSSPNTLTIAIENREENPTYQNSDRLLPKIRSLYQQPTQPLLALYPLEQFFVAHIRSWGLYEHDPGNVFFDESGRNYTVEELLMATYGVQFDMLINKHEAGKLDKCGCR